MTDRYVDATNGDNSNDGSFGSPWKDLQYALTGSRVNAGDTIYISSENNVIENIFTDKVTAGRIITVSVGSGDGPLILRPLNDDDIIEIQIPQNCGTTYMIYNNNTDIVFDGLRFTNPNEIPCMVITFTGGKTVEFVDCHINMNNHHFVAGPIYVNREVATNKLVLNRVKMEGIKRAVFQRNADSGGFQNEIEVTSCLIIGTPSTDLEGLIHVENNSKTKIINNTFVVDSNNGYGHPIVLVGGNIDASIQNNSYIDIGPKASNFIRTNNDAQTWFNSSPECFIVKHNIWEAPNSGLMPSTQVNIFNEPSVGMIIIDHRNWYIESLDEEYKVPENSHVCGRGNSLEIPTKSLKLDQFGNVVRGGDDWFGYTDIGAFKNGSETSPIIPRTNNSAMLFGDSISENSSGVGTSISFNAYSDVIEMQCYDDDNPGAIGGITTNGLLALIDYNAVNNPVFNGVLMIGANHLNDGVSTSPENITDEQLVSQIVEVMRKISAWGMKPYWMGLSSLRGDSSEPDNTRTVNINSMMETACFSNGWGCENTFSRQQTHPDWKTRYYDDITTNVHPNAIGRQQLGLIANNLLNRDVCKGHIEFDFFANGVFENETKINLISCNNTQDSVCYIEKDGSGVITINSTDGTNIASKEIGEESVKVLIDFDSNVGLTINKSEFVDFTGSFGAEDFVFFFGNTIHAGWIKNLKIYRTPRFI